MINLFEKIILYTPILNLNLPKTIGNIHELTKLNLNWNWKGQINKIKTTMTKITLHPNYKDTKYNLPYVLLPCIIKSIIFICHTLINNNKIIFIILSYKML